MKISELFKLDGKVALVTGCTRGIGRSMTIALAEAGADIIGVSASIKPDSEIENDIKSLGRSFKAYKCDLSERKAVYRLISDIKKDFPSVDILVNNAGITLRKPAAEYPDDYWENVIEVNQTVPFILAREFGSDMVVRGSGKIIFIASLLTFQGGITVPAYAASKGAIGQLTKSFANEWASKGVNVNAIAPGYISTDFNTALINDKDRNQAILSRIPAGKWGEPDDFKGAIVYLASKASDYVHGSILLVDGGWMGR